MSAHLRAIHRPLCSVCRKPATATLYNTWNAPINDYCGRHAQRALKDARAREEADGSVGAPR